MVKYALRALLILAAVAVLGGAMAFGFSDAEPPVVPKAVTVTAATRPA